MGKGRGGSGKKKKKRKSKEKSNLEDVSLPSSGNSSVISTSSDDLLAAIEQAEQGIGVTTGTQQFDVSHLDNLHRHGKAFLGFPDNNKRKRNVASGSSLRQVAQNAIPEYVRFLYITNVDSSQTLKRLNPFLLRKAVEGASGGALKSARFCKTGSLLVETYSAKQTKRLLSTDTLLNGSVPVEVSVAQHLNTVQGTIYAPELEVMSDGDILDYLKSDNVIQVRHILKKDKTLTHVLVLTFGSTTLPETILCGFLSYRIRPYYPYPLRCYKCQKFGHGSKTCRGEETCGYCAQLHSTSSCSRSQGPKCMNCKDQHPAYSRSCPHYKREEEIVHIKVDCHTTYDNARKIYLQRNPVQQNLSSSKSNRFLYSDVT